MERRLTARAVFAFFMYSENGFSLTYINPFPVKNTNINFFNLSDFVNLDSSVKPHHDSTRNCSTVGRFNVAVQVPNLSVYSTVAGEVILMGGWVGKVESCAGRNKTPDPYNSVMLVTAKCSE